MATNMMRSLTYTAPQSAEAECPPKDIYTLELVEFGEFQEKSAFNDPSITNIQSRVAFKIVDFDYDPDMDERDWNGLTVADFYVFWKRDADGRERETWKSDRAKSNELLRALLGRDLEEGEEVDLEGMIGRRIKAQVEPKESGWPKITSHVKARQRKSAKPAGRNPFDEDDE